MGDMKHYLRKMDFPAVVPEALHHMQKLWLPDCSTQQIQLMSEVAEEFVFFEIDKWSNRRRQPLKPLKELQIIERLSWYFSKPGNDQKIATFLFLFPCGMPASENRLPFLSKLVSLAIAISNGNVLNYVGMWMQLYGCISEASMYLTKTILETHIKSVNACKIYADLFQVSPIFCCSVMIAITNCFLSSSPPVHVCEIILNWVSSNPEKCYAAFKMTLPRPFAHCRPQTPLPGLLFWCILSPFHKDSVSYAKATGKSNVRDVFSDLHLAVLQCLLKARTMGDLIRCEVLPVESLVVIVDVIKKSIASPKECMKVSLDRFAQSLEVALSSGCIYPQRSKLGELFILCCDLPYNRLLKVVLQKWSSVLKSSQG